MTVILTGAAGFIGYHVAQRLLQQGETVVGLDNLNAYYDVGLKQSRLEHLKHYQNFIFYKLNLADRAELRQIPRQHPEADRVVHLAAQPGVQYSLQQPFSYAESNLLGHLAILEMCRQMMPRLKHLVYASSSSVYGANQKQPFSIDDPVDQPISLYAATKRADELMSYTYSHLYKIPSTGLRYFTVYGPWGRPDMSPCLFAQAILAGKEFPVYNQGQIRRNFTYIDDVVAGTLQCLEVPPAENTPLHRLYNIGNNRSEELLRFIEVLEQALGKKAKFRLEKDLPPGDIKETIADIQKSTQDFGFRPKTNIEEGIALFAQWYKQYYCALAA